MTWHYAFGEHTDFMGDRYYMVEEVYTHKSLQHLKGHTASGIKPMGDTKEELLRELQRMLDDLRDGGEVVFCPPDRGKP